MTSGDNGISRDVDRLRITMTSAHADSKHASSAIADDAQPRRSMNRKASSPMMPAFMVSAPGKVIVFGEHAVVYGKVAIAAAISLRSYLLVTSLSKSKRTLTLRFPDVGMSHTWNIDELPWELFSRPGKKKFYYDLVTALDPDLLAAIQPHLANISLSKSEHERKVHQSSALSFLYLFLSLGSQKFPGSVYTLRSTIPIGAGLGSSASIAVCMATALLLQIRTLSGPHPDQPPEEARLQIERINRWAFVAEMCIHGNPSGVDNTVAAQGKAVIFQRAELNKPPSVKPLWHFPELPLLLVNTRQPKSTQNEVAKVARLRRTRPDVVNDILSAMNSVARSAIAIIEAQRDEDTSDSDDSDADNTSAKATTNGSSTKSTVYGNGDGHSRIKNGGEREEQEEEEEEPNELSALGELMTINHGLLCALGVSHPRLERVRELVDHEGIGWTKLTGAGGGGCSITLIKKGIPKERILQLEQQLEAEGYQQFVTTLGGDGVGVLWPAVLRNGMDEDEEGGMEIDVEKFLNAMGNEGVERLVGVEGGGGEREGWKFWR
ncbi:mevalonate kinase [Niveomyces insectorum RCEF 264]|uniref:Mevalonate kinase n=1 Tax=Niveomyces insectorum RCEF 264 TaxID=1081102 RepID=A0A167MG45_9HYPO|nr:mevalonate kinase [Niveomyces insectorum RCEF 264]